MFSVFIGPVFPSADVVLSNDSVIISCTNPTIVQNITLSVIDDNIVELNEIYTLEASIGVETLDTSSVTVLLPDTFDVLIVDDDCELWGEAYTRQLSAGNMHRSYH
jgi:hypothetical protein